MKKASSKRIIEKKISELLAEKLINKGYKYFKGKREFIKSENGVNYTIGRYYDINDIYTKKYILGDYSLWISFDLYFKKNISGFENWYKEHFSKSDAKTINLYYKSIEFCIPLVENIDYNIYEDFSSQQHTYIGDDQYLRGKSPDAIWEFQNYSQIVHIPDFESNINKIISMTKEMEQSKTDFNELYYSNEHSGYLKTNALLIYINQLELPTKYVKSKCEKLISEINQMTNENEIDKQLKVKALNRFIAIGKKFLKINIENPF